MTSTQRNIIVETLDWRGILIEVRYEPEWLGNLSAHLAIKALDPSRVPLPITETGYRSHFTDREIVEDADGPSAYVLAWLERASTKQWKIQAEASRQYALF